MLNTVNRPRQKTATQRAAEQIRQLIISGELSANTNHLESALADRLGISRTPVREATLMLQSRGLLEVQPRKGVRICAIAIDDLAEIYLVNTELECLAARLVAGRRYSATELEPLNESVKAMDVAHTNNQKDDWAKAEKSFSLTLIELSANKRIAISVTGFSDQLRRVWTMALRLGSIPDYAVTDYREQLGAMLSYNIQEADTVLRRHREKDREFLMSILEKSGLRHV